MTYVLFDLNGTLVDDVPRATRSTNAVLASRGLELLSQDAFRDRFVLPLTDFMAGLDVTDKDAAIEEWNAEMAGETAPAMPGARELLTELRARGVRTGVVSAAGCRAVHHDLEALGLAPLLDVVHCDVADKAAVLSDEQPDYYVGDTAYDVTAANAAGVRSIAFSGGYSAAGVLVRATPSFTTDHLLRVLDVL